MNDVINLAEKLGQLNDHWSPRVVAELNDYQVKVVKLQNSFVWHKHVDTDELFLVLKGTLTIRLRDREVRLQAGELYVVPRGVEHQPHADRECHVLLIEPRGVVNTGDAGDTTLRADNDRWL